MFSVSWRAHGHPQVSLIARNDRVELEPTSVHVALRRALRTGDCLTGRAIGRSPGILVDPSLADKQRRLFAMVDSTMRGKSDIEVGVQLVGAV